MTLLRIDILWQILRSCFDLTLRSCYVPFFATYRYQNVHLATAKLCFWSLNWQKNDR